MTAFTAVGVLATLALVWAERAHSGLRNVAKPLASVCFVAVAVAGDAASSPYGRWVLAALLLSAFGDVALLDRSSRGFIAGLTGFLVAHLAYIGAFWARGISALALVAVAAVLIGPAGFVVRWLRPHVAGPLWRPVLAYAAVISLMVAAAAGTVADNFDGRIIGAAVAFYLSDLAVARDRFVAPGFVNRLWGLPLYYAAQFVFAWTV